MTTRTQVLERFIEQASRVNYGHQLLTYLGDASSSAYNIPLTDPGAINTTGGTTRGAPTAPTNTSQVLNVNRHASHNKLISSLQRRQTLGGAYVRALADEVYDDIMAQLDDDMYAALVASCVANAGLNTAAHSGGNVLNGSLAAVTRSMVARFEADLVGPGNRRTQFLHLASPRAFGEIRSLYDSQIGSVPVTSPMLGVDFDAVSVNGIPLIELQSMPNEISVASSACVVTSNVAVATVPAGHPFQVGMEIYTTGGDVNVAAASAVAITAATATSVTYPLTTSNETMTAAPVIICPAAVSMLVPRNKAFWAGDAMPDMKEVDDPELAGGTALQCFADYGRHIVDGVGRMLLWPN